MNNKARVEFAPDGLHFHKVKQGSTAKMWDYFNFSPDIMEQTILNPQARFKLIGETGITIGILPSKSL